MKIAMNQISSLEKVRFGDKLNFVQITSKTALAGERISYQVVFNAEDAPPTQKLPVKLWVDSTLQNAKITVYRVNDVLVDKPAIGDVGDFHGDGYIIEEPGFLPDILVPIQEQNNMINLRIANATVWVKIDIPSDAKPGKYTVTLNCGLTNYGTLENEFSMIESSTMEINVVSAVMPEQKLIYTRWFYADCVADVHNVPIFSEEHWALMDKYIEAASDIGII